MKSEKEIIEVIAQCLAMVPVQLSMAPVKDECLRELAAEIAPQLNRKMLLSMFNQKHNPDEYTLASNVKQELDHLVLDMEAWLVPTRHIEVDLAEGKEQVSIRSMGHYTETIGGVKLVDIDFSELPKALYANMEHTRELYQLKDEYVFPTDREPSVAITNLQKCMAMPIEPEPELEVPLFIYKQLNAFIDDYSNGFVKWLVDTQFRDSVIVDAFLTNRKKHAKELYGMMCKFKQVKDFEGDTLPVNTSFMRDALIRRRGLTVIKEQSNPSVKKFINYLIDEKRLTEVEVVELFTSDKEQVQKLHTYIVEYGQYQTNQVAITVQRKPN